MAQSQMIHGVPDHHKEPVLLPSQSHSAPASKNLPPQIVLEVSKEDLRNEGGDVSATSLADSRNPPKEVSSAVSNLFYHRSAAELARSQDDFTASKTRVTGSNFSVNHEGTKVQSAHSVADNEPSKYSLHGQPSVVRSQWSTQNLPQTASVQSHASVHDAARSEYSELPKQTATTDQNRRNEKSESNVVLPTRHHAVGSAKTASSINPSAHALHETRSQLHLEKLHSTAPLDSQVPPSQALHKTASVTHFENLNTKAHSVEKGHPQETQDEITEQPVKIPEVSEPHKARTIRPSIMETVSAKRMVLLNNGEKNQRGVPYVLNEKKVRTWDVLLREWTDRVKPSFGPVRRVFTPVGGTEISNIGDLKPNAVYVLSGAEKLKPADYKVDDSLVASHFNHNFNYAKRRSESKPRTAPEKTLPVFLSGDSIPDRRHSVPTVLTINVHKNGDDINPPVKITLKKFDLWNLTRAKDSITDRVKPVGGTVKSIYTVSGIAIEHVTDLQPNGYYVAVGPYEKFHPLNYEPAGRHDHFLPMSAKHPSVYTKDAAARASVGMKRRRTFILRLKRKSVNQSNTGQHSEIEQPMTIQAETVPENQPHSGSERRLHTSGTRLGEHQRIDLHSVNLPPHSKHSAHEQQQHDNNQFGDPESEILVHMRHENEKPHGVPSVTAEPTARSQHLLAETNSRTNQSHHSLSQPKSETVVTTLEPSRLQLPKGGSHFLSPKPSKHLRTSSQKDLHSSQMSGWSNASNFRNALDGQLADGSHTSINNADLHSFHVTGPSQTSVALGGGHPASLVDLKDPASDQSVISVQPVPSEARNKASKEHSSLSMRQVDKSSTSISPLETSPSQQSQRVEPSESAIEENRLNGYENNVISNTSVASYYSRASAQSKAPSVANVLGRQPHSDHDITSDSNARVHVNDGNVEEQTLDKAVEESHQPVEVAPPMTDEPPPTAAESKGRDAKPRRKSKLGCC